MAGQHPPGGGLERVEVSRHLRHELRTAHHQIVGYSELLLEGAGTGDATADPELLAFAPGGHRRVL